jgi:hypothetical protein
MITIQDGVAWHLGFPEESERKIEQPDLSEAQEASGMDCPVVEPSPRHPPGRRAQRRAHRQHIKRQLERYERRIIRLERLYSAEKESKDTMSPVFLEISIGSELDAENKYIARKTKIETWKLQFVLDNVECTNEYSIACDALYRNKGNAVEAIRELDSGQEGSDITFVSETAKVSRVDAVRMLSLQEKEHFNDLKVTRAIASVKNTLDVQTVREMLRPDVSGLSEHLAVNYLMAHDYICEGRFWWLED